jgi:VWFA-related protein
MRQPLAVLLSLLLLSSLAPAGAQQPPPQPPPPQEPEFRVPVRVELVTVPLVVWDARAEFVYDLAREEVTLLDNGVPQQLRSFELGTQPVSLVVLVDTSQRVKPLLERVREVGILITSSILGQDGEAALLTFDSFVTERQEFTSDAEEFLRAFEKIPAGGTESRLADGLDQAVRLLSQRPEGRRRVILVIAEALDKGSSTPLGVPLRVAQLNDITVYTISLSALEADLRRRPEDTPVKTSPYPPGVFTRPGTPGQPQTPTTVAQEQYARADIFNAVATLVRTLRDTMGNDVLEVYALGTGGVAHSTFGRAELEAVLTRIGQDLHSQYLITYTPSNRDQNGYHKIELRLGRPGLGVRHRPGYFVGPPL